MPAFSDQAFDRRAEIRSDASALDELWRCDQAFALGLNAMGQLLVDARSETLLNVKPRLAEIEADSFLGAIGSTGFFATSLSDAQASSIEGAGIYQWIDLRQALSVLRSQEAELAAYARALHFWRSRCNYCGACGSPLRIVAGGHQAKCLGCGTDYFPRLDPAIIVLVTHGEYCLLGRQAIWPKGRYSALAGFVEPGETLEQAVAREVLEESGVRVSTIAYAGSQPWPFPSSLMIAFNAEATTTDLRLDDELEDAQWFDMKSLALAIERGEVSLPTKASIAHYLIDAWCAGQNAEEKNHSA